MKTRLFALVLSLLLLSGCASMLERSHASSTTHVDYSVTEDASILRAETYQGLVNSILYFVNERADSGTIRLYNYTGDVESDLTNACDEVLREDPLGAFSVRDISYDSTRILTYYEVELDISYSRPASVVDSIQSVSGVSGLRQELARTVGSFRSQTFLRVSYFSGDAELVENLFWLAYYSAPLSVRSDPKVSVAFYPETGSQRIVEIHVTWPYSTASMAAHISQLEQKAAQLMAETPPEQFSYTLDELAALLGAHTAYSPEGSSDPAAVFNGEPAGETGMLLALELLCQQAGMEVSAVFGEQNGAPCLWLIVNTADGYRHLLSRDLPSLAGAAPGRLPSSGYPGSAEPSLPLYTDEELTALGYSWPNWLHPACVSQADGAEE